MRGQCMLQPYGMSDQLLAGAQRAALALAESRRLASDMAGYRHWLSVAERMGPHDADKPICSAQTTANAA